MKYISLLAFLLCISFSVKSQNQKQAERYFDKDLKIWSQNDSLYIDFNDPAVTSGEVLVYESYEDIKLNSSFNKTPIRISIKNWPHGWYHIKLDYGMITQFRQYYL